MSVVWSHKIQEKQADILTKHYKRLEPHLSSQVQQVH
ncbi:hypothetical protein [Streptococcus hyointestinalis]